MTKGSIANVLRPAKHSTRLNVDGSEWRSERVCGMPDPSLPRQGVTVRVQTGTNRNRNRVRVRNRVRNRVRVYRICKEYAKMFREEEARRRRGGAEEGRGLAKSGPPLQYPPTHPVTYASYGKPPSPCTHTDLHLGSSYVSRVAWFKGRR